MPLTIEEIPHLRSCMCSCMCTWYVLKRELPIKTVI